MKNYKELKVYELSYSLALEIYKLTKEFPQEEKFSLVNQLRRAAISVPLNIVEGVGRHGKSEFKRFISIACGSTNEVQCLINFCKDLNYIKEKDFKHLEEQYSNVLGMLISLYNKLK